MAANIIEDQTLALRDVRLSRAGRLILDISAWALPAHGHGLLLGPSGSGKTTLLHLIAGLERAPAGSIRVLGQTLSRLTPRQLDRFRARHIGLVFQDFHLLESLSVLDNLLMPQWLAGRRQEPDRAREILERLGAEQLAEKAPHVLSQGEKQRVAIARSVINHPRLILADEPTSALDDDNAERVMKLLQDEAEHHGASLLLATHDQRIRPHFEHCLKLEGRS